jgi:hypothetical protein
MMILQSSIGLHRYFYILLLFVLLLSSCGSENIYERNENISDTKYYSHFLPAIVPPSVVSHEQIKVGLNTLLGQATAIEKGSFTTSNSVLFERIKFNRKKLNNSLENSQQGIDGSLLAQHEKSFTIQLMTDGEHCYLVHKVANRSVHVENLACVKL